MKLYLFFSVGLILSNSIYAQWSVVGAPNFTDVMAINIYTAIAPNGEPYVVFRDGIDSATVSSGRVMKFNGSNWVNVGPRFSAGDITCPTMAFDKYGTPYVAYGDDANCFKATVLKFDGTNWISVGMMGFSPGPASYTSIAFDTTNTPYVAFRDVGSCVYNSAPNGYRASVMKFDGTDWIYVGAPGFSTLGSGSAGALYTSLAIDKNNTLYVAYTDFSNGFKATVMTFDGTNWVNVGAGIISAGQSGSPSIVLDSYNVPYVAFVDIANSGKAAVMKFDGSNWIPVDTAGFTPGNAEYTSLAIDNNDKLYLAFEDFANGHKASVMTFNGTNWVTVGNPGFSATKAFYTSIAVDKNSGTLYVAYEGYSDSAIYPGTVMKYDIMTGTQKVEPNCTFSVYPNPTNRIITVSILLNPKQEYLLLISNSLGQTVYSETVKNVSGSYTKQLDLSYLPKGSYYVNLYENTTNTVNTRQPKQSRKIIIQ